MQQESGDASESTYAQVQFNYDTPLGPNRDENSSEFATSDNEVDKAFVLPKNFEVPSTVQLPDTMKQHAIVEKTARFISAQGPQMEILIKAKQSNNQQFDFLNQNNSLNPYYKFVLSALKSGTYPELEIETPDGLCSDDKSSKLPAANNDGIEDPFSKPYIPVPTIKYTPSANCAYTQLISKIKGVPLPPPEPEKQQQQLSNYTPVLLQQNTNSSTHDSSGDVQPQSTLTNLQPKNVSNALMLAHYCSSDTDNDDQSDDENKVREISEKSNKEKQLELCFPIPPDYLQNIIDKTAGYVIKNGRQFEETLRIKNDERFTFLFPDNEYYSYYMYKVTGEVKSYMSDGDEGDDEKQAAVANGPVSFSIKIKEDQPVPSRRPALPQEASDDESEKKERSNGSTVSVVDQIQMPQNQGPVRSVPEHVQKAIQLVESQLMARNAQLGIPTVPNRSRFDIDQSGTIAPKMSAPLSSLLAAVAEHATPTMPVVRSHQKELKRAEEKVKDKLAQIAREKLGGLISKEKQLQIERKKKAMAFLNQIKGTSHSSAGDTNKFSNQSVTDKNKEDGNESDASSVHSIPISSYGDDKSDTEIDTKPCHNILQQKGYQHQKVQQPTHEHQPSVRIENDDDVQFVSAVEIKKPNSRSRIRQRTRTPEIVIISPKRSRSRSRTSHKKHSKSKSQKSKKKSSKHSHHHSKKKSKKRSRSQSTYRSQSYSENEGVEEDSSSDSSSRKRRKRSSSHKKKKSKKHDR